MLVLNYGFVLQDIMIYAGNGQFDPILGADTMVIADIYQRNKSHQMLKDEPQKTTLHLMLSGF